MCVKLSFCRTFFIGEIMNFKQLKSSFEKEFESAGILETSDIDWIVCEVVGKRRSELARIENFSEEELLKIQNAISLRLEHIPLGYIFGKTNFYGYDLNVTRDVLIPRLDTEILIERIIKDINKSVSKLSVLDIGTGSGAIAIVIKKETIAKVTAVDVSKSALLVAMQNAKSNNAEIEFVESDLFENLTDRKFDIIVSNPPYIESEVIKSLDKEVKDNEPMLALDGGTDGLDFYRKIIRETPNYLNKNGKLYFEIGYNQGEAVSRLMQEHFKNIEILKDYEGNDRVVLGELL